MPASGRLVFDEVVRAVFVHHSADPNDYGPGDAAEIVREIQYDSMHRRGWDDIGYHFLVDRYGTVYEGRSGALDIHRVVAGSHAAGFNRETVGIAVIGTCTDVPAPEPALDAVARLAAWRLAACGTRPDSSAVLTSHNTESLYRQGTRHVFRAISGHRDAYCTQCPGDALYSQLPDITRRAAFYWSRPISSA
ncbi:N-acetylmuramoyl-L-alanine amidase [Streptomyces sp. NRRL B-24484]|uniref:N-acetylmuramoyl-L-alanine amidase n=1 Tax=Streptomyces sp. NRRL B-24484 TaxID=1463833 RepID=UPI001331A6E8|nr:N-acetylmuramoyl-L-alanine amidase [Streptomyces sp. NRRL B-24484]